MFNGRMSWTVLGVAITMAVLLPTNLYADQASEMAQQISHHISTQEWLGPIGAIALSPFFGLACLSGAATFGPESLRSHSSLLSDSGPMNNPYLFWTMLALTLLSSAPRFTKVSKPIALLADKLESYSAILILVAMRFFSETNPDVAAAQPVVLVAGLGAVPMDILVSLAAAVNLIVINTVKNAIEFLVWLVPIPLIDSLFEIVNKSLCASFALLYAYSPVLSLLVNACLFTACAFVFLKVLRLSNYFKKIYVEPMVRRVLKLTPRTRPIVVAFTMQSWNGLPRQTRLSIKGYGSGTLDVYRDFWMWSSKLGSGSWAPVESGVFVDVGDIHWSFLDPSKNKLSETPLRLEVPRGALESLEVSQMASVPAATGSV